MLSKVSFESYFFELVSILYMTYNKLYAHSIL